MWALWQSGHMEEPPQYKPHLDGEKQGSLFCSGLNWMCLSWRKTCSIMLGVWWGDVSGLRESTKNGDMLTENLIESSQNVRLGWKYTFQLDNDPNDTAKTMQEWLRNKSGNSLWPSQRPASDLESLSGGTSRNHPPLAWHSLRRTQLVWCYNWFFWIPTAVEWWSYHVG